MPEEPKIKRGKILRNRSDTSSHSGNDMEDYVNAVTEPGYPFPLAQFEIEEALDYIRLTEQNGDYIPENWQLFQRRYGRSSGFTFGELIQEIRAEREKGGTELPEEGRMGQTPRQRDPRLIRPWDREGMSFENWVQSKLASGELVKRTGVDGKTVYSLMPEDGNPTARGNIIRIDYSEDGRTFTRYMYEDTNGDGRLNKDVLIIERFNTTKVAGESLLVQTARIDNSDRFDSNTFSVSDDGSSISFTAKKDRPHFRFDTVDDNRRPTQATYAIAFYEPRADGEETKVTKPGDLTPLAYIEVYDQDTDQLLGQWHVNAQTGEMTWSTKNAPALKEHENRTIQRIQADDLTDAWKQGNKGFHLRAKYDSKGRFITTDEPWRRGLE